MGNSGRLELANDNAASFWLAQAAVHGWETVRRPGFTAVRCDRDADDAHRVVVTRPYGEPAVLEAELFGVLRDWRTAQVCVEDPYRRLDLGRHGYQAGLAQAVMVREAGALPVARPAAGEGLLPGGDGRPEVEEAGDADALAEVERVVVEGFPIAARQPWRRGDLLPAGLLDRPGYRAWLARIDGRPAGGCMTYDNGGSLGVYWVATLPEHRSRGVGRAVVSAALATHPERAATLVATLLGEPLYRRLGFTEQGTTRWWRHTAATGAHSRTGTDGPTGAPTAAAAP